MVLGTHHRTRKFIHISQDIDTFNNSQSTDLGDVEKVKLHIKLDGVSLNRVSLTKVLGVIIDETYHGCDFKKKKKKHLKK